MIYLGLGPGRLGSGRGGPTALGHKLFELAGLALLVVPAKLEMRVGDVTIMGFN